MFYKKKVTYSTLLNTIPLALPIAMTTDEVNTINISYSTSPNVIVDSNFIIEHVLLPCYKLKNKKMNYYVSNYCGFNENTIVLGSLIIPLCIHQLL